MDKRKNNGGHKTAGRKSKAEEQNLIEKLTPFEDEALKQLEASVKAGHSWAIKMYFEYKYGKPKETKDISINALDVIDMSEWK